MLVGDAGDNLVEGGDVADVDLVVGEGGGELRLGSEGDLLKVGVGLGETVDGVDCESVCFSVVCLKCV